MVKIMPKEKDENKVFSVIFFAIHLQGRLRLIERKKYKLAKSRTKNIRNKQKVVSNRRIIKQNTFWQPTYFVIFICSRQCSLTWLSVSGFSIIIPNMGYLIRTHVFCHKQYDYITYFDPERCYREGKGKKTTFSKNWAWQKKHINGI